MIDRIPPPHGEIISDKRGITVSRIEYCGEARILKSFESLEDAREISNYRLLKSLGIPTLEVIETFERALILEDISAGSGEYRLAVQADMADPAAARAVAGWYALLHSRRAAANDAPELYREYDAFSPESIDYIRQKIERELGGLWDALVRECPRIRKMIDSTSMTLNYNDFYYTNMAVSTDRSRALMFDYNLLGAGTRYADIRNVTSSLSPEAARAFFEAYGELPGSRERALDEVVSPLHTLVVAFKQESFPAWGEEALEVALSGGWLRAIDSLLST